MCSCRDSNGQPRMSCGFQHGKEWLEEEGACSMCLCASSDNLGSLSMLLTADNLLWGIRYGIKTPKAANIQKLSRSGFGHCLVAKPPGNSMHATLISIIEERQDINLGIWRTSSFGITLRVHYALLSVPPVGEACLASIRRNAFLVVALRLWNSFSLDVSARLFSLVTFKLGQGSPLSRVIMFNVV